MWLIALTAAQAAALLVVYRLFVQTRTGQAVDTIALTANWIGRDELERPVNVVLNAMSVVSLALVTALVFFIAVYRRRFLLAVAATVVIAGANITTQLLKYRGLRPDFGIDPDRVDVGNTLPSGHTTIAAAVAIALIMVLPRAITGAGALALTGWAAFAGIATLAAGWHRPSDAVAAFLVAGVWASASGLLLLVFDRNEPAPDLVRPPRSAVLLVQIGIGAAVVATVLLWLTHEVVDWSIEELSVRRFMVAYAGGAAGIGATACLVLGLVAASVPYLVPRRLSMHGETVAPPADPAG
jgi:membrane-associated phospholipid phosphatase